MLQSIGGEERAYARDESHQSRRFLDATGGTSYVPFPESTGAERRAVCFVAPLPGAGGRGEISSESAEEPRPPPL